MKNIISLLLNDMSNMNVSILQNDYRIQNVGILLGGCLTVKNLWGNLKSLNLHQRFSNQSQISAKSRSLCYMSKLQIKL